MVCVYGVCMVCVYGVCVFVYGVCVRGVCVCIRGMDWDTRLHGKGSTVRHLLSQLYSQAGALKHWGLIRMVSGMLRMKVEELDEVHTHTQMRTHTQSHAHTHRHSLAHTHTLY